MNHILKKIGIAGGGKSQKAKPPIYKPPVMGELQYGASHSYAETLDLISEGPIGGIVNSHGHVVDGLNILQGVYLDNTAVAVTNNSSSREVTISEFQRETIESFKSGIGQLIDQDIKVISNPLTVFPNSEMSKPEYIEQWKIDIESFPSDWSSEYGVEEYEDLVVATSSFTRGDWEHMLLWNWSTIFLETYYWTDIINREQPLDTVTWYNWCLDWFTDNHNPLQEQLIYWQDHLTTKRSYELWGGGVGTVDIDLNTAILEDVTWSTTLRTCTNAYCDHHYIPRLDDSVFVRQQNNHVTMPGYKSLAHQLVANRWNFLSRQ